MLDLAHNVLARDGDNDKNENEYEIARKRIGYQLQGMEELQRIIAKKLISDVMREWENSKQTLLYVVIIHILKILAIIPPYVHFHHVLRHNLTKQIHIYI